MIKGGEQSPPNLLVCFLRFAFLPYSFQFIKPSVKNRSKTPNGGQRAETAITKKQVRIFIVHNPFFVWRGWCVLRRIKY